MDTSDSASGKPSSELNPKTAGLGDYVRFSSCGVKIRQPKGFQKANTFDGFEQPDTLSVVMVVTIPGPYTKYSAGFTPQQMKQRGWAPLSRKNVEVAGLPGIFLHFEQGASGIQFLKWSLVFGDDKHTVLVTAAGPKEEEPKLLELLRSAVLSTRPDESAPVDPAADVPFTLDVSKKLRLTKSISRSLAYSKDGSLPLESPKDPVFMAVSSFGKTEARDQRQFAEKRIRSTPNSKRLSVKSTKPITINGLSGFESIAEAEDAKSGTPTLIYEVMLFRDRSYFLMSGLVGKELAGEYLPEFKAMARSFRVKDLKKTR